MKFLIALILVSFVVAEATTPLSLLKSISEIKKGDSFKQVSLFDLLGNYELE